MKVMDGIKQAVLAQDWNMICKIYTAVTKEPLEPPKPKSEIDVLAELELPESLSNALSGIDNDAYELQKAKKKPGRPKKQIILPTASPERDPDGPAIRVDDEELNEGPVVRRQRRVKQRFGDTKGQLARTESINTKGRKVKFFGEGANSDSHKNNPELQKLYGQMKHTRTLRESPEDMDVVCSVCGTEERVSTIVGASYNDDPNENTYKCNSCCSGGG